MPANLSEELAIREGELTHSWGKRVTRTLLHYGFQVERMSLSDMRDRFERNLNYVLIPRPLLHKQPLFRILAVSTPFSMELGLIYKPHKSYHYFGFHAGTVVRIGHAPFDGH